MRCALKAGFAAASFLAVGCVAESSIADIPADDSLTFDLSLIDGTRIPQATVTNIFVVAGHLKLHPNGVFSDEVIKSQSTPASAYQAAITYEYSLEATGFWTELPGGRYELKYADRLPFRFDTAVVADGQLTKNCRPFWCGGAMVMTYR